MIMKPWCALGFGTGKKVFARIEAKMEKLLMKELEVRLCATFESSVYVHPIISRNSLTMNKK